MESNTVGDVKRVFNGIPVPTQTLIDAVNRLSEVGWYLDPEIWNKPNSGRWLELNQPDKEKTKSSVAWLEIDGNQPVDSNATA